MWHIYVEINIWKDTHQSVSSGHLWGQGSEKEDFHFLLLYCLTFPFK